MKSLATWCVRHRLVVVLLWIAALVGMSVLSNGIGTAYSNNFSLPHTESTEALQLLQTAAPKQAGDQERIVLHTTDGTPVTGAEVQSSVDTMLAKVAAVPHVTTLQSPFATTPTELPGARAGQTVTVLPGPTRSVPTAGRPS